MEDLPVPDEVRDTRKKGTVEACAEDWVEREELDEEGGQDVCFISGHEHSGPCGGRQALGGQEACITMAGPCRGGRGNRRLATCKRLPTLT